MNKVPQEILQYTLGIWTTPDGQPFTGRALSYHKNSSVLEYDARYKAGKKHGIIKLFHSNASLRSLMCWKKGELHGTFRKYYRTGKLHQKGRYRQGKLQGLHKSYYPMGTLKSRKVFRNGEIYGAYKYYNRKGELIK